MRGSVAGRSLSKLAQPRDCDETGQGTPVSPQEFTASERNTWPA